MGGALDPLFPGRWPERVLTRFAAALALCVAVLLSSGLSASPAHAATKAEEAAKNPDKLYIEADELVYDKDHNTVTATGGVVLYYKNRILQADKVVYDRASKRVHAEGHTKFTDEKGDISYSPKFDLTDDFASGFADSVQLFATDRTRMTSTRVERSGGSVTVLDQGAYTACEPCKAHPEQPALWQVRAARVIENQTTHTIYFEHAWLDVYGVPVLYLPYFSAPDPTVTRASGFLAPQYTHQSQLGYGVTVPYFLALAPNYDLTLAPGYFTQQGAFADITWRHRLANGEYSIRLTGIDQTNPGYFLPGPYGSGNRTWRGSLESQGKFYINENWKYGWDLTFLSDRFYLNDYHITAFDPSQYYFQDIVSSVYLRGQEGRGFFDLSGYRFQPTTAYIDQRQEPTAAPVFDYHRTFAVDPETSHGIGGEVALELNAANVSRAEALYQSVGAQHLDQAYNIYSVCVNGAGATTLAAYAPGNCLLRGIGGDNTQATVQASWQRKIVDPLGEVWTPFVFARFTGSQTELNNSQSFTYGTSVIPNGGQDNFFAGSSSGSSATGMPGVGLEYRYPFVSHSALGDQVIEPIAQVIVRPNEMTPRLAPNEDAQSLVFDETTLFAWSKYSGYDRVEGGTRLNYGLQYTANFANGGHANVVGGQSVQLAGRNSYTIADAANTGLESGLDKTASNYVLGETIAPTAMPISFTSKQQFDSSGLGLTRFDGIMTATFGGLSANLDYGRYAAQPLLGWVHEREGVLASASYKLIDNVTIDGSVVIDMSRHLYDTAGQNTPRFYPTNYHVGIAYNANDCTIFHLSYTTTLSDPISTTPGLAAPPTTRDQTFLFELTLRTLGDIKTTSGVQ